MADTLRALDAAVQAHIAENFPGAVTDSWVLVTHSNGLQDDDHDLHNYRLTEASDAQPWHTSEGLVRAAVKIMNDAWDFAGDEE